MILLDYCHCYGQCFVLEVERNNNFQTTLFSQLLQWTVVLKTILIKKLLTGLNSHSNQSPRWKKIWITRDWSSPKLFFLCCLTHLLASVLSSLSPICPCLLLSEMLYIYIYTYIKDFQKRALSTTLSTSSSSCWNNLHYNWCSNFSEVLNSWHRVTYSSVSDLQSHKVV